jgi:hypothetical protein
MYKCLEGGGKNVELQGWKALTEVECHEDDNNYEEKNVSTQ